MTDATFEGTRVLVVGGAGFVGSNLCHRIAAASPRELIIVDNFVSADFANVLAADCVRLVVGSITDDSILAALPDDLDFVFHLATFHGNQSSIAEPLVDHENNTLTTLKLCERLRRCEGLRKVVYASAGCTVAEKTFDTASATSEDASVTLYYDSPYQISKIIGELYGNYYHHRYGLPFVKARFQNVYGPREVLGAGRWRGTPATVWRNVTPTFIYKSLKGQPLPVENGGIATRDFIFVDDIVEGLLRCAVHGEAAGVYNLASGEETSILGLAKLINELTGNSGGLDYRPPRDWDRSGKRFGATDKAERELGFRAKTTLRTGLERTVAWTRAEIALVERCISQHAQFLQA